MKKPKPPISQKKILAALKKEDKRNVTFSIPEELLKKFKSICDDNSVSMNETVEKLIETFVGDIE